MPVSSPAAKTRSLILPAFALSTKPRGLTLAFKPLEERPAGVLQGGDLGFLGGERLPVGDDHATEVFHERFSEPVVKRSLHEHPAAGATVLPRVAKGARYCRCNCAVEIAIG